jgi:death on curing protein
MILIEDILEVHQYSIANFGGSSGLRDKGSLESAIARPFQTFGGEDLYPSIFEKAAALGESLIVNHPFVDGNKRTGFLAMVALLEDVVEGDLVSSGFVLNATNEAAYDFCIKISTGEIKFDEIVEWLKNNSITVVYPGFL